MILEKGRAKPVDADEIPADTLEARLTQLAEMKADLKERLNAYKKSTKHLRESIRTLEEIVSDEVLKLGKTVTVGNIRAEYVPTVKIKMKKEKNNDE